MGRMKTTPVVVASSSDDEFQPDKVCRKRKSTCSAGGRGDGKSPGKQSPTGCTDVSPGCVKRRALSTCTIDLTAEEHARWTAASTSKSEGRGPGLESGASPAQPPDSPRDENVSPPEPPKGRIKSVINTLRPLFDRKMRVKTIRGRVQEDGTVPGIPAAIMECLASRGIPQMYSHQAEVCNRVFEGRNVVVATPTASGKSITFFVPVLEALLTVPKARALFLYPLKALGRDQLNVFRKFLDDLRRTESCRRLRKPEQERLKKLQAFTYDGDVLLADRAQIRSKGSVILTNPDMLHWGILPKHSQWAAFLRNLKFVVLDEAHHYRGVFGSHLALVLRRLLRLCRHTYQNDPQVISASATIGNPAAHVGRLFSSSVECVDRSGAPCGPKHMVFWDSRPCLLKGSRRKSFGPVTEAAKVLVVLMMAGLQTLAFVPTRALAEYVAGVTRNMLEKERGTRHLANKVDSYRAGYDKAERMQLERDLASGKKLALVSTSALELGIDIGSLDATLHFGVSSKAALFQQAGRAGRRTAHSMAVIIATEHPLDAYYMRYPEQLLDMKFEEVRVDPENGNLLLLHLQHAAREMPLRDHDAELFGPSFQSAVAKLTADGLLEQNEGGGFWERRSSPPPPFGIRGSSTNGKSVAVRESKTGEVIEQVEPAMASYRLHPGAVLHHRQRAFQVDSLNIEEGIACVDSCNPCIITDPHLSIHVMPLSAAGIANPSPAQGGDGSGPPPQAPELELAFATRQVGATSCFFGRLLVSSVVESYERKVLDPTKLRKGEPQQKERICIAGKCPPYTYETTGLWVEADPLAVRLLRSRAVELKAAFGGVANLFRQLVTRRVLCDPSDIQVHVADASGTSGSPQLFCFDCFEGGVGIMEHGFRSFDMPLLQQMLDCVRECACKAGCPKCIGSCDKRGVLLDFGNSESMKKEAILLLEALAGSLMNPKQEVTGSVPNRSWGAGGESTSARMPNRED